MGNFRPIFSNNTIFKHNFHVCVNHNCTIIFQRFLNTITQHNFFLKVVLCCMLLNGGLIPMGRLGSPGSDLNHHNIFQVLSPDEFLTPTVRLFKANESFSSSGRFRGRKVPFFIEKLQFSHFLPNDSCRVLHHCAIRQKIFCLITRSLCGQKWCKSTISDISDRNLRYFSTKKAWKTLHKSDL